MVAAAFDASLARVVFVDNSADSREVFHTLMESRGVLSVEVSGAWEGLEMVRQHRPAVVVLDLDADAADNVQLRDELAAVTRASDSALVVLGEERHYLNTLPDGQVIAKPYHYGPVVRTIERLLVR